MSQTPPRGNGHALPSYPLPSLADVVSDARIKLTQTIETLGHQRDMTSYPVEGDGPWDMSPGTTDRLLGNVVANIRVALEELEYLASELPAISSASPIPPVHVPGPPLAAAADEGDGPPSHRGTTGEGPTPGHTDAAATASCESPGVGQGPGAGDSFTLPVWPGTQRLAEQINASIAAEKDSR